jgi:putative Mn2+ efflux pump MntP
MFHGWYILDYINTYIYLFIHILCLLILLYFCIQLLQMYFQRQNTINLNFTSKSKTTIHTIYSAHKQQFVVTHTIRQIQIPA